MNRNDEGSSDKVGYKRPPKAHRFKPGQSGNPRGRPRRTDSLDQAGHQQRQPVSKILASKVRVTGRNGRQKTMTYNEAIVWKLVQSAAAGSTAAARHLHKLQRLETEQTEKQFAFCWSALAYQKQLEIRVAREVANGAFPSEVQLHPDDIEINWETLDVKMFLAVTQGQVLARKQVIEYRDEAISFLWCHFLNIKEGRDGDNLTLVEVAEELVALLNAKLPSRFQRDTPTLHTVKALATQDLDQVVERSIDFRIRLLRQRLR